ncbi:MAG: hypothetical protein LN590_06440 [Rickettsia endosymbiont of Glossina mortisans submortisans]|nr:hypothetical protein [Rickettsia endosymbiont of Glossina mortisans submortisans]
MFNSIKNNKIFYLSPVNQLLKEGLRQQEMFFVFHDKWPFYSKKAVNLLFESAVENLTCAMLLGEEEAILPLSHLYYSGTIYDILPDLVFGDYIILIGQKLGYKSCQNISLRMITNTKCLEKQLDSIAITITSNMLFYHRHFKYIGDEIKKKLLKTVMSNLIKYGIFVNLNIPIQHYYLLKGRKKKPKNLKKYL